MANDKRFIVKNGLETQNIRFESPDKTKAINTTMLDTGTLTLSGTSGNLLSVKDADTGTVFYVNDISGTSSLEIDASGTIRLSQTAGNVLIGTASDNTTDKLQVNGSISGSILKSTVATGTSPLTVSSTTKVTNLNADLLDDQSGSYYLDFDNFSNLPNYIVNITAGTDMQVTGTAAPGWTPTINNTSTLDSVTDRGATTTNALTIGNLIAGSADFTGSVTIEGDLLVTGNTVSIGVTNLELADNMIYLNQGIRATITNAVGNGTNIVFTADNNYTTSMVVFVSGVDPAQYNFTSRTIVSANSTSFTVAGTETGSYVSGGTARGKSGINPDLGWAAGYNDGTYAHAGMFRDATDGRFKVFKGYTPEPDESIYIDTDHASFSLADFQAKDTYVQSITSANGIWIGGNQIVNASAQWVGSPYNLQGAQGITRYSRDPGYSGNSRNSGYAGYSGNTRYSRDPGYPR
jgi:hypothetical protein